MTNNLIDMTLKELVTRQVAACNLNRGWLLEIAHPHRIAILYLGYCSMCCSGHKRHDDFTSSSPSFGLSSAICPRFQTSCWQLSTRVSLWDLTQHFTTELATVMHHLRLHSQRQPSLSIGFTACQALKRFFATYQIKPHAPFAQTPSIPLSFILTNILPPGRILNALTIALHGLIRTIPSIHHIRLGLLGYLIPFSFEGQKKNRDGFIRYRCKPTLCQSI